MSEHTAGYECFNIIRFFSHVTLGSSAQDHRLASKDLAVGYLNGLLFPIGLFIHPLLERIR